MLLEICANSYQSAKNAQEAGAHRIELCQELSVGGITPSYGLIKQVITNLTIPTFVLIRPRSGNFVYTDKEFDIMKSDIKLCKELGCSGIVSGVLNADQTIDVKRTQELVALSKPLSFTFHRAFDEVKNPSQVLQQLMDLGVERVLTSGQKAKATDGIQLLKELKEWAQDKIVVMPGSGINSKNASVFKEVGFKEIHASASTSIPQISTLFSKVQSVSDPKKIKALLDAIS